MKVLGTNVMVGIEVLNKMREKGYSGHRSQFRIICKCRGITDANRKCKNLGLHDRAFVSSIHQRREIKQNWNYVKKRIFGFVLTE